MVKFLALLLSACACFGQAFTLQDTAFLGNAIPTSGTTVFPTNLPNATSISWWKASDYYTNAGVPTLPDSGPGGYALTNMFADSSWPTNGGTLNGNRLLRIGVPDASTSKYLKSVNYTSSQPHTVCLVMRLDDNTIVGKFIFSGAGLSTDAQSWVEAGGTATDPKKIRLNAGTAYDAWANTNTWLLVECLFSGASSRVWTNGVATAAAGDSGAQTCSGFTLGASYVPGAGTYWLLGEAMTYSTAFTVADRTALYSYVKNKYGSANFSP